MAAATWGVASVAARTGPSVSSTAGIRVSRSTGRRMPLTAGARPATPCANCGDQLGQHSDHRRTRTWAPGRSGRRRSARAGLEADVDVGLEVVGRHCLCDGIGLVERHHVAPRWRSSRPSVRVRPLRPPNWPSTTRQVATEANPAQTLPLAQGGDAGPVPVWPLTRMMTRRVSGPHTPSAGTPQFDWKSSSARPCEGRRCRPRARSRSRGAPNETGGRRRRRRAGWVR
jgi:hypothetical protein